MTAKRKILEVENLSIGFLPENQIFVDQVSFFLEEGEILGICGESGSGKSITALSLLNLLPENAFSSGKILYQGHEIQDYTEREWQKIRGKEIAMVFQDQQAALNPTMRVGQQIAEVWEIQAKEISRAESERAVVELLDNLGLTCPGLVADAFPHELSGGMRQRIGLAMAFAGEANIIICDEATTALDISLQEKILGLLKRQRAEAGSSIIFISHDIRLMWELCDRVLIFYAGEIVETGTVDELKAQPAHPYTKSMLAAMPSGDKRGADLPEIPGRVPGAAELAEMKKGVKPCLFANRCPRAKALCFQSTPEFASLSPKHQARCHFAEEVYLERG